jgi:hypothetical protein
MVDSKRFSLSSRGEAFAPGLCGNAFLFITIPIGTCLVALEGSLKTLKVGTTRFSRCCIKTG